MTQPCSDNLRRRLLFAYLMLVCVLRPGNVAAQQTAESEADSVPSAVEKLTLQSVQTRRKQVEDSVTLDEATKTSALELLGSAATALQQENAFQEKAQALQKSVEGMTVTLEKKRAELEAPTEEPEKPSPGDDLSAVQQQLQIYEEQLRGYEAEKATLDQKDIDRTKRRTENPVELTQAHAALETLTAEKPVVEAEGQNELLEFANRAVLESKRRMLVAKIAFLERELPIYNATSALLAVERSLAARRVAVARRTVTTWQEYVNLQRASEAETNLQESQELSDRVSAPATPMAQEVVTLASGLVDVRRVLSQDIAAASRKITQTEERSNRLKKEFDEITARAEAAGLTNSVGVLLRKQNSSLPDQRKLSTQIADRQTIISDTHIQRIEYQNQRSAVADVENLAERSAEQFGAKLTDEERRSLRDEFRLILQQKGRFLDGVISDLSSYLDRLATLDVRQRSLLQQTVEQSDYIAENVLWVRSATSLDTNIFTDTVAAVRQLRTDIATTFWILCDDAVAHSQMWVLATLLAAVMLSRRGRMRQELIDVGEQARRKTTTSMRPTLIGLGLTAVVSAIWPLVLWFLSWRLLSGRGTAFFSATGYALQSSAIVVFTLDFLRHVCRPSGLGTAHFAWPSRSANVVRMSIRALLFVAVPLAAMSLLMQRTQGDLYQTSLGRLSLITALLVLAVAMHQILRPGSAVLEETVAGSPDGWIRRTRYFWYALGVGIPIVLSLLAISGYLYTAQQLSLRLVQSGMLVLVVVMVSALLERWQLLTYRALAMKQARERRAALQLESKQTVDAENNETPMVTFEVEVQTLSDSNVRLQKLLSVVFGGAVIVGLLIIWSDVMPAIGILSRFELWESSIATSVIEGVEQFPMITLSDLLLAFGVLALTVFSAANIPGLLEFSILQRLPVDSGTRYATSTVVRYAITVIGVAFSFRMIGVGWANIQWLVAAMTVGLGFGLQEIFANFVSGLILLFERPIRIGDTVTVGDITGTVTRIRIRATTIVDWDRKELVVPNREFVTGQLINWTLSDSVLRVVMAVGIAYGSDTRLATDLLYKVARDNPNVLDDPAPKVIFNAFGASSLDFELRCFVGSPSMYRNISHDLNLAIDDLFRQNKIEIAFPQQDLHVRSFEVPVALARENGAPS